MRDVTAISACHYNDRSFFIGASMDACACAGPLHAFMMRDQGSDCCIRISEHPVRTLTGRYIRRPLADSSGNNNFESAPRGDRCGQEEEEEEVWA